MTLDNFVRTRDFSKDCWYLMKIDVEGFEKEVLLGARDFLMNYQISGIVFECFSSNRESVFEILKDYGFVFIKQLSKDNYFATKYLGG
ncbi:MAG: FkbM family methyltransferase [Wolinella sp.]